MAEKKKPASTPRALPSLTSARAEHLIREQLAKAAEILKGPVGDDALRGWKQTTHAVLAAAFGDPSENLNDFDRQVASQMFIVSRRTTPEHYARDRTRSVERAVTVLESCLEQLNIGLWPTVATSTKGTDYRVDELVTKLAFVNNEKAKSIIERDLRELAAAAPAGLWKSCLLLCGSILEAVLLEVLDRRRDLAQPYLKKKQFPDDANLHQLIEIASDIALIDGQRSLLSTTAAGLAGTITEHRDLVHPHAELRGGIRVDRDTAEAMIHLLKLVIRDLAEAGDRGDIRAYEDR